MSDTMKERLRTSADPTASCGQAIVIDRQPCSVDRCPMHNMPSEIADQKRIDGRRGPARRQRGVVAGEHAISRADAVRRRSNRVCLNAKLRE